MRGRLDFVRIGLQVPYFTWRGGPEVIGNMPNVEQPETLRLLAETILPAIEA